MLHGHADPAQDPAPQRAVVLVVELLELRRLADLVEEGHVDVRLQEQQQRGHGDEQHARHHRHQAGRAQHARVDPLVVGEQAEAVAQDAAHSAPGGPTGPFVGPVALALRLQLGLDVRVVVQLPQQPGGALDWRGEDGVDAPLAVLHWGGHHAGTGAAAEMSGWGGTMLVHWGGTRGFCLFKFQVA